MGPAKPSVEELGLDVEHLSWQRSATGADAIEVAMVEARGERWVLFRLANARLVSVFDENEWRCFLAAAKRGEFDDLVLPGEASPPLLAP